MKVRVAEAEPFGSVDSDVEGKEEGVAELRVLDLGDERDGRG